MNTIVAYERSEGGISLLYPAPNCGLTLTEIIKKDVPTGARYVLLSRDDIPTDRTYRNAWAIDFSNAEVN